MKRLILSLVCLLMISAAYADGHLANEHGNNSMHVKDTISVVGNGMVEQEPDQVVLSLSVSAINKDIELAKAEADKKYQAVIDAAKNQQIVKTDIKLSNINLQPEYDWRNNTQTLLGTRVSRSLSITVNDLERVAPLLQELVVADVSTINNIQTGFKDRAAVERKALAAAIADAKEKAQYLADSFGKKLGATYSISETGQSQPTPRHFAAEMIQAKSVSNALPEEHFGNQSVRAQVNVVFHAQ